MKLEGSELKPANANDETAEDVALDVLVLGAGWAGLGAGRRLLEFSQKQKKPFRFRILEARDYIGGRSRTVYPSLQNDEPAAQVELGSHYIHGASKQNPMYQLALQEDIMLHGDEESFAAWQDKCTKRGIWTKRLSDDETAHIERTLLEGRNGFYAYLDRYPAYQRRRNWFRWRKSETSQASVRRVLEKYAKKRKLTPEQRQCLIWLVDADLAGSNAASLEDINAELYDEGEEFSGGDAHFGIRAQAVDSGSVAGGYSRLIKSFAAPLVEGRNGANPSLIECGCVVTSIDYSTDKVIVEFVKNGNTSPQTILARRVLCTVPLGVLKAGSISIHPPLPSQKLQAIDNLGMGVYNKVVLIWNAEERHKLPWLGEEEQQGNPQGGKHAERVWMERIPLPGIVQGPWSQCYNARTRHDDRHPIVLVFFMVGRLAESLEMLSDAELQAQAVAALREWFKSHIPEPSEVIATRWKKDPFAMGSYSFYSLTSSPSDRELLASPVQDRLYFAGEATSIDYYATTHGALMTGRDAADLIWKQHLETEMSG